MDMTCCCCAVLAGGLAGLLACLPTDSDRGCRRRVKHCSRQGLGGQQLFSLSIFFVPQSWHGSWVHVQPSPVFCRSSSSSTLALRTRTRPSTLPTTPVCTSAHKITPVPTHTRSPFSFYRLPARLRFLSCLQSFWCSRLSLASGLILTSLNAAASSAVSLRLRFRLFQQPEASLVFAHLTASRPHHDAA
ncbi:hypothetical protein IWZ01DRAFT_111384 [Phyllosticta capitalensis]|uniref:Secreted protein n=1 Tax=Phyllosticta capitalensis TaxID=121624 RepID=A0ABR1YAZ7_9PEZI